MAGSLRTLRYRLIACDLDGTLVRPDGVISARNRRALEQVRAAGALVTLVTGRTFPAVEPILRDLRLTTPIIVYNGAKILHPLTGQVLFHRPIPSKIARRLLAYLLRRTYSPVAFVDTALYSDRTISAAIAPRSGLRGMSCHVQGDAIERFSLAPDKIGVIGPKSKLMNLAKQLSAYSDNRVVASRSYPTLLEMTNRLATKGRALRRLARHLGVPRRHVIAIGDSDPDQDMIEWAGLGVAMGNATARVRISSDYCTASVSEDGVAQALERFVLSA
jgi:Cof subfamily protein (haloacid dehalogenase superfamily)